MSDSAAVVVLQKKPTQFTMWLAKVSLVKRDESKKNYVKSKVNEDHAFRSFRRRHWWWWWVWENYVKRETTATHLEVLQGDRDGDILQKITWNQKRDDDDDDDTFESFTRWWWYIRKNYVKSKERMKRRSTTHLKVLQGDVRRYNRKNYVKSKEEDAKTHLEDF